MPSGKRSSPKRSSVGLPLGTRFFPCPRFRSPAVTGGTLPRRSFRLPAAILKKGAPGLVAPAFGVAADVAVVAARRDQLAFGSRLLRRPFLGCIFRCRLPSMSCSAYPNSLKRVGVPGLYGSLPRGLPCSLAAPEFSSQASGDDPSRKRATSSRRRLISHKSEAACRPLRALLFFVITGPCLLALAWSQLLQARTSCDLPLGPFCAAQILARCKERGPKPHGLPRRRVIAGSEHTAFLLIPAPWS